MHCAFTYVTTHQSFRLIVKALNKFADSLIRPSAQQCPGFWFSLLNSWSMARTPLSIVFKSGLVQLLGHWTIEFEADPTIC